MAENTLIALPGNWLNWDDEELDRLAEINPAEIGDAVADSRRIPVLFLLLIALGVSSSAEAIASGNTYSFLSADATYVNHLGQSVAPEWLVSQLEGRAVEGGVRLLAQTDAVIGGNLPVDLWQQSVSRELKRAHLQAAMLGRGGRDQMTPRDWGRVGRKLRDEYRYLRDFAQAIAEGRLSEAQIKARLQLYANGIRSSYYKGVEDAMRAAGAVEEERMLNPAEHCDDCVGYAAQGRVPLGTLPAPGEGSVCRHNCKCGKVFYNAAGEEVAFI